MKKTASNSIWGGIAALLVLFLVIGVLFLSRDVTPSTQKIEKPVKIGANGQ